MINDERILLLKWICKSHKKIFTYEYLNEKLAETKVSSMEAVFYQLIEQQTKNMMLASIKDEYVFKVIEPPQVPELKDSPKRALMVLLGAILGGLFSVYIIVNPMLGGNKIEVEDFFENLLGILICLSIAMYLSRKNIKELYKI